MVREAGQRAAQAALRAMAPPAPVLVMAPPAPVLVATVARKRKRAPSTRPTKAQVLALQAELVKVRAEMENWKNLFLQLSAVVNI